MKRNGRCLCGSVRFSVSADQRGVVYCHCSQCRRQTGHFLASVTVPESEIEIEADPHLRWYAASDWAKRGFCGKCGSMLFWKQNGAVEISFAAGALEKPSGLAGQAHIFVADKGDYYGIDDGLPQHDGSPSASGRVDD